MFVFNKENYSGDAQLVNSVYFDNDSLELYHGRLDKKSGAIALRVRCVRRAGRTGRRGKQAGRGKSARLQEAAPLCARSVLLVCTLGSGCSLPGARPSLLPAARSCTRPPSCSWYGPGDPKLCFIERKTHRDSWKGARQGAHCRHLGCCGGGPVAPGMAAWPGHPGAHGWDTHGAATRADDADPPLPPAPSLSSLLPFFSQARSR